ncbi:unnamed protein product, partial [Prorocentrum cordatum]
DTHKAAGSGGRRRRPGGRAALARAEAGGGPPEARSAAALLEEARGEHDGRRDLGSFIKRADHLTHDDVPVACEVVRGQVVRLSIDQAGCFLIQSLLERAQIPMQKQLVAEMHGHVVELLESQHGNHVLQKAIETLPPTAVLFVLRELCERRRPRALARLLRPPRRGPSRRGRRMVPHLKQWRSVLA